MTKTIVSFIAVLALAAGLSAQHQKDAAPNLTGSSTPVESAPAVETAEPPQDTARPGQ